MKRKEKESNWKSLTGTDKAMTLVVALCKKNNF